MGDSQLSKKQYTAAVTSFDKSIAINQESAAAYLNRGMAKQALKQHKTAIQDLLKAAALDADDSQGTIAAASSYEAMATTAIAEKKFDDAVISINQAIKLVPTKRAKYGKLAALVYSKLGLKLLEIGNTKSAETNFKNAIDHHSESAEAYAGLAQLSLNKDDFKVAADQYVKAAKLDRDVAVLYNKQAGRALGLFAETSLKKQQYATAAESLQLAATLNPAKGDYYNKLEAVAHNLSGYDLHRRSKFKDAIAEYSKAVKLDPNKAVSYRNRGYSYKSAGEYTKAIDDYTAAIKLDPNKSLAYKIRGEIRLLLTKDTDYSIVLSDLNKAAELAPTDAMAHYYLSFIYAACPDKFFRDPAKGLTHATKACDLTKHKNWEYLTMLAAAHAEGGMFEDAVKVCEKALELAPQANKAPIAVMRSYFMQNERLP